MLCRQAVVPIILHVERKAFGRLDRYQVPVPIITVCSDSQSDGVIPLYLFLPADPSSIPVILILNLLADSDFYDPLFRHQLPGAVVVKPHLGSIIVPDR